MPVGIQLQLIEILAGNCPASQLFHLGFCGRTVQRTPGFGRHHERNRQTTHLSLFVLSAVLVVILPDLSHPYDCRVCLRILQEGVGQNAHAHEL